MSDHERRRPRIIYLTFGESPSGVYVSQVIATCKFLSTEFGVAVRLVAFVSPRAWRSARAMIHAHAPDAWVLPAVPRVAAWRPSVVIFSVLCALLRPIAVIARSVPATNIALRAKSLGLLKAVCLDGRGAVAAERREYLAATDRQIRAFTALERDAVLKSDCQIAVSEPLRRYWAEEYGYLPRRSVVIPCLLADDWLKPVEEDRGEIRRSLGFASSDVVIVYSGSTAGWQSFAMICDFVRTALAARADLRFLFLTDESESLAAVMREFPSRVKRMSVPPVEVFRMLAACDYGLLLREASVTNRVASPTKLAEYLGAGLPVILSEGIGDYTAFVRENDAGFIADELDFAKLQRPAVVARGVLRTLASSRLSRPAFRTAYAEVLAWLGAAEVARSSGV